jgi:hypothetical protein
VYFCFLTRPGAACCRLLAFAGLLASVGSAIAAPRLLFIGNPTSPYHASDAAAQKRLETLGYTVTAGTAGSDPSSADLIVISATADGHSLGPKFRDAGVPLITWNALALPELGMTGQERDRDYGYDTRGRQLFLYFVNEPHALSAGVTNGLRMPYLDDDSQNRISWGKPGLGAAVVATLPGELEKAVYFGYEQGAQMSGEHSAPARRVMLFLSEETFVQLNPTGLKLFDAAVAWAGKPVGMAPSAPSGAKTSRSALFVVNETIPARFHEVDLHVQAHLEKMGFAVTRVNETEPPSRADGMDLVVVSSTVSGHVVAGKFTDSPVPVLTWEAYVLPHMHMAGKLQEVDYYCDHLGAEEFKYLSLVNAPHPIAAGLPNGLFEPFIKSQPQPPAKEAQYNWGHPGPGASVIATLPGEPRKAGIFCYERGAAMYDDFPAPARRVMFFLHSDGFDQLNPAGVRLFDAAIWWAVGATPP